MPSISTRRICLAVALYLTGNVIAIPQITFPINSQLPPVAYVLQPFEFSFSPNTFTSDVGDVSYALSQQPTWLSLENSSRRLLGTPGSGDAGAPTFEIIASDKSGQVSSSVTLVVQQEQKLFPDDGEILSQLSKSGGVSAPATLILHPQEPFAFSLDSNLFNGSSASTNFYAVSSDGSPLPSWIQFDPTRIRFTGTTPPSRAPEPSGQSFPFKLAASEVVGFSEASLDFDILVNNHTLAFTNASFTFKISKGSSLQTQSLLQYVTIDGIAVTRNQLTIVNADIPSWLQINDTSLSVFGSVPNDIENSTFSITIGAIGTNVATATLGLQVSDQQNQSQLDLGVVYATPGTYLVYELRPPAVFDGNKNLTIRTNDLLNWLSFTQTNMTLHGLVPANGNGNESRITFTFSDANTSVDASLTLTYTLATISPTSTGTSTTTEPSATSSIVSTGHASPKSKSLTLILSIILPMIALIALLYIVIFWKWRPKKRQQLQPAMTENTSPLQPSPQMLASGTRDASFAPKPIQPNEESPEVTDSAPYVEIPWDPDSIRRSRERLFKKIRASQSSAVGSSWDDLIDYRLESKDNLPPMPAATFKARKDSGVPISLGSQSQRIPPKRPPRPPSPGMLKPFTNLRLSNSHTSASQVTIPKRLSGVGHGSGRGWNAVLGNPRSSWQTTLGTIPMVESRPSIVVMGSFPAPPSNNSLSCVSATHGNSSQHEENFEPTMRLVPSSSAEAGICETAPQTKYNTKLKRRSKVLAPLPDSGSKQPAVSGNRPGGWESYKMPPIPQRSHARPRGSSTSDQGNRYQHLQDMRESGRKTSVASSGRFDSAVSSDSQWEDDISKANSNDEEKEQWRTVRLASSSKLPPPPRLIDQRRKVSVEQSNLERTQRSHKGSLRFI